MDSEYIKIKKHRYKKDINSIDIYKFLERTRIKTIDIDKSKDVFQIICPFNDSHKNTFIHINPDWFYFDCSHCKNTFIDVLDLYPNSLIESCCSDDLPVDPDFKKLPAKLVVDLFMIRYDIITDFNGMIYLYNKIKWEEVSTSFIKSLILEIVTPSFYTVKYVNEIVSLLLATTQSKSFIEFDNIKNYMIPLKNGCFNLKEDCFECHKKSHYLISYVCCDYEKGIINSDFETLTLKWFDNNNNKISDEVIKKLDQEHLNKECINKYSEVQNIFALQEFSGFCLMLKAKYKKALLIYGPKDTGKSIYASIIREIIGIHNVCSIPLDKMDDQNYLAPIKGKMLNMITDLSKDSLLADGGFKSLVSGGDGVQINEKYKPQQVIVPNCKHIFITNNLPSISDTTNAVFERLIFLCFKNVVAYKDQNPNLLDELLKNKQGILNWVIEGAKTIYKKNGIFTQSADVMQSLNDYQKQQNPINEFLSESFLSDENGFIPLINARDLYRNYSGNYKVSSKFISKLLKDSGIEVFEKKVNDKNIHGFSGFSVQK